MKLSMKLFKRTILIVLTGIIFIFASFFAYNTIIEMIIKDDTGIVLSDKNNSKPVKLENFHIYGQQHSWSCGPTTISMVYSYLVNIKSEDEVLSQNGLLNRNNGMQPGVFKDYLKDTLKDYDVELKNNIRDSQVLEIIYSQLKNGIPVPVYFSTVNDWDKPNYDTHFSSVIGIDMNNRTVTIANAYGFEEKTGIDEFLSSLKYENYKHEPLMFRIAVMLGVIKKNNIYILTKK